MFKWSEILSEPLASNHLPCKKRFFLIIFVLIYFLFSTGATSVGIKSVLSIISPRDNAMNTRERKRKSSRPRTPKPARNWNRRGKACHMSHVLFLARRVERGAWSAQPKILCRFCVVSPWERSFFVLAPFRLMPFPCARCCLLRSVPGKGVGCLASSSRQQD